MSVFKYSTVGGRTELLSFNPDGKRTVDISFSPVAQGFLRFGTCTVPVKDGRCSIPLNSLKDGIYEPTAILAEKSYTLNKISLLSGHAEPLPISEESQRELYVRVGRLEEQLKAALKTVEELTQAVYGKIL
jgi:hypothetical protein